MGIASFPTAFRFFFLFLAIIPLLSQNGKEFSKQIYGKLATNSYSNVALRSQHPNDRGGET